jgi:hypothetical protein
MTQTQPVSDAAPDTEGAAATPEVPTCRNCSAPMAGDQDWCLNCGQAAPGRLGRLPGMRAAGTVVALTLALSAGAVAAAYAALSDDPPPPAPAQLAQVAPTTTTPAVPPAADTPAPAPPATQTAPPATETAPPVAAAPPASGAPTQSELDDLAGQLPSGDTTSGDVTPSTPTPTDTSTSTTDTTSTEDPGTSTPRSTTSTTPTAPPPEPIDVSADAITVYDPYTRVVEQGKIPSLLDDNRSTAWFLRVPDGATDIHAGITIDLGTKRGIREIDIITRTPGFDAEIYATDSDELPPDVLDARWAHIHNAKDVGKGSKTATDELLLGAGSSKYRHLLIWFTTPPPAESAVRLASLQILG